MGPPVVCKAPKNKIITFFGVEIELFCLDPRNHTSPLLHHYQMHRYSFKVILRKERPRKDGYCPLSLQAFINGRKKVISLNINVDPALWDENAQRCSYPKKGNAKSKSEIDDLNMMISSAVEKATRITRTHYIDDRLLTAEGFEQEFKHTVSSGNFLEWLEAEIAKMKKTDLASPTVIGYGTTLRHLRSFNSKLTFNDITVAMIEQFDRYLSKRTEKVNGKRVVVSMNINSRWKHHKNLKKFIRLAVKYGIKIANPYNEFTPKQAYGDRTFLHSFEVTKLMKLREDPEFPERLRTTLDMFLFSCWTSLRISDILKVDAHMIIGNELVFVPHKTRSTKKVLRIPLNSTAAEFIKYYSGKLFGYLTEQYINRNLKEIAEMANINKRVTFHVARHTFAMMFLEVPGNKVEVLKEIMGHADIETTMVYVHIHGQMKHESMARMDEYAKRL